MANKYKLAVRAVEVVPIAEFELAEGETLEQRVAKEIASAAQGGKLDRLATRVGLPSAMVQVVADGENLTGGDNVVGEHLFGNDGTPLDGRDYVVAPAGKGFSLTGQEQEQGETLASVMIGVFPSEDVARMIGQFWKSGHLPL